MFQMPQPIGSESDHHLHDRGPGLTGCSASEGGGSGDGDGPGTRPGPRPGLPLVRVTLPRDRPAFGAGAAGACGPPAVGGSTAVKLHSDTGPGRPLPGPAVRAWVSLPVRSGTERARVAAMPGPGGPVRVTQRPGRPGPPSVIPVPNHIQVGPCQGAPFKFSESSDGHTSLSTGKQPGAAGPR